MGNSLQSAFLPLLLLAFLAMMIMSGRRQRKQMQQTQQMQSDLVEGDTVMTIAGLRGTVVDASYEDSIDLEIAPGVVTTWQRSAVRHKVEPESAEAAGTEATPRPDEALGNPSGWDSPGGGLPGRPGS